MNPAFALGGLMLQQSAGNSWGERYMGLEVFDSTYRCDWARRYIAIDGSVEFAIRLNGSGRHYRVSGFWKQGSAPPLTVSGTFNQLFGRERGPIRLHSRGHKWKGQWNRHLGCFELLGESQPSHVRLWQELRPMPFRFLQGQAPLAQPHDVPDNLMGYETETQALYAFSAGFRDIVRLADRELLEAHWKKSHWRSWDEKPGRLVSIYSEPGPTGRVVSIEPNSSVPDWNAASDLIMAGTRRKGWVGITVNGPKVHG